MATEVLERKEQDQQQTDAEKQPERPRLYKRFAVGFRASISFPGPPEKMPKHWFE